MTGTCCWGCCSGIGPVLHLVVGLGAPAGAGARAPSARASLDRLQDELVQAGYDGVWPAKPACPHASSPSSSCFALVVAGTGRRSRSSAVLRRHGRLRAAGRWSGCEPAVVVPVLRDLWPDAVDNIASGVRAGLALPEALSQLGQRGPEELRPAFRAFGEDYRTTGRFHECLDRLKERLSDPVGDRLVESLRIAREVGGSDLGRLLRTLSTFLREDARTRAELETRQGWTVNAARLAVGAPWIVLALMATRRESVQAYSTRDGHGRAGRGRGRVPRCLPHHAAHRPAARGRAGAAVRAAADIPDLGLSAAGAGLGLMLGLGLLLVWAGLPRFRRPGLDERL